MALPERISRGACAPMAFGCIKGNVGAVPRTLVGGKRIYLILYRERYHPGANAFNVVFSSISKNMLLLALFSTQSCLNTLQDEKWRIYPIREDGNCNKQHNFTARDFDAAMLALQVGLEFVAGHQKEAVGVCYSRSRLQDVELMISLLAISLIASNHSPRY